MHLHQVVRDIRKRGAKNAVEQQLLDLFSWPVAAVVAVFSATMLGLMACTVVQLLGG